MDSLVAALLSDKDAAVSLALAPEAAVVAKPAWVDAVLADPEALDADVAA